MKVSNKILLVFLILVFATPVFLFMGFRNKIKKGEFTVTKTHIPYWNETAIKSNGSIKQFKVLKIVDLGAEDVFFCSIISASAATYEYTNFVNSNILDSISFQQKGDTLLVTYIGTPWGNGLNGNSNIVRKLRVNLYLPVINNIIVEGANISIDSVNTTANPEIYFDLSKKASLTLGRYGTATTVSPNFAGRVVPIMPNKSIPTSTAIIKSTGQFSKVIIRASDSYVNFGSLAWIKVLDLQMLGLSKISVDDQCRISQLNGVISDSATIEANLKNFRRFATIKGK